LRQNNNENAYNACGSLATELNGFMNMWSVTRAADATGIYNRQHRVSNFDRAVVVQDPRELSSRLRCFTCPGKFCGHRRTLADIKGWSDIDILNIYPVDFKTTRIELPRFGTSTKNILNPSSSQIECMRNRTNDLKELASLIFSPKQTLCGECNGEN